MLFTFPAVPVGLFLVLCLIDPTNVDCCVLLVLQLFGNRMTGVVNLTTSDV